jgi:hypothetical protein
LSAARENGPRRTRDHRQGGDGRTPDRDSSGPDPTVLDALGDGILGEVDGVAAFGGHGAEQFS